MQINRIHITRRNPKKQKKRNKQYPEQADELFAMAEADAKRKYEEYKKLAEQE